MDERIIRTGSGKPVRVNPNFIDPVSDDGFENIRSAAPGKGAGITDRSVSEPAAEFNGMRSKYIDPISDFDSDTITAAADDMNNQDRGFDYSEKIDSEDKNSYSDDSTESGSDGASDKDAPVYNNKVFYSQYTESANNEKIKEKYEYLRQPLSDDELENLPDGGYAKAVRDSQKQFLNRRVFSSGDSKPLFVLTLVNGVMYILWFIIYVLCTIIRAAAFASAEQQMILTGQLIYTVKVSSPLFGVLKVFAIILPIMIMAWIICVALADKKKKAVPDKRLLVAVMIIDAVCAATAAVDIMFLHMIFV